MGSLTLDNRKFNVANDKNLTTQLLKHKTIKEEWQNINLKHYIQSIKFTNVNDTSFTRTEWDREETQK